MSTMPIPVHVKPVSTINDTPARPKIGLALSGAVMRGTVHVGVLRALEAAGIPIDMVSGASAGALVGALYCAGLSPDTLAEIATTIRWRKIAHPVFPRHGFMSFAKLERWLIALMGDIQFSDLSRPLAIVATDLERGMPVTFTHGRLAPVVHGSSAVPGFAEPVAYQGYLLGDGGISNNLPVSAVRALGADIVIAVDLFVPTIHRPLGPLRFGLAAVETMVRRSGGGIDRAEVVISPPELAGESYFRTGKKQIERLVALGEHATAEVIPEIQAALGSG